MRFINPYKKLQDNYVSSFHFLTDCGLIESCLINLLRENFAPTMVCVVSLASILRIQLSISVQHICIETLANFTLSFPSETCYGKEEE